MGSVGDDADPRGRAEQAVAAAHQAASIGDWPSARTEMARAIDLFPNDAGYHALMGRYTQRTAGMDAVERQRLTMHHLGVALEIDPQHADAHCYLGDALLSQGNPGRARTEFEAALRTRPDHARAREALDRLSGKAPAPTARATPSLAPRRKSHAAVLAAFFVICGTGAALALVLGGKEGDDTFSAADLGTTLEVTYAVARQGKLIVELARDTSRMGRQEIRAELVKMAAAAGRRGISSVSFRFAKASGARLAGRPFAVAHNGDVKYFK